MPKFTIREQQTIMDPRRVNPEQTGAAVARGMQAVGAAVGQVGKQIEQIQERDRKVEQNRRLNEIILQSAEREEQYVTEFPSGEGMSAKFDEDWSQITQQIREDYRRDEDFQIKLDNLYLKSKLRVEGKQAVFKSQYQVSEFKAGRDEFVSKVSKGTLDGETALDLINDQADALAVNPATRGALIQENQDEIGYAMTMNELEDQGFVAADEMVDSKYMEMLSPSTRNALKSKIRSEAGVHVRRETQVSAEKFKAGYPVGDLSGEIEIAERFGFDDQALQMETIQALQTELNSYVKTSITEMNQTLRQLDKKMLSGDISDTDMARLSAYRNAVATKIRMLREDPYTWLDRSGYLGEPVAYGDPTGDMSAELEKRRGIQARVLAKEGVRIPLYRPEEIAKFNSAISQSTPEQQVALVTNMTSQLDGLEVGYAAEQVAPKDPTLAVAMLNSPYAPDVTRDILLGRSRDIPTAKDTEYMAAFMDRYGAAIEDEEARQQAVAAIIAADKEHLFRTNDSSGVVSNKFNEIAERVIGPVINLGAAFGGKKTLSFRDESGKYVDNDTIKDVADSVTEDDFISTHGDTPRSITGRPLDIDKMFKNMQIVSIGDGKYAARNNLNQYAMTADGKVFEIDMRLLLQNYQQKPPQPGLFDFFQGSQRQGR